VGRGWTGDGAPQARGTPSGAVRVFTAPARAGGDEERLPTDVEVREVVVVGEG
jgi:hypothetical protein